MKYVSLHHLSILISTNLGTLTLASGSAENLDDSGESNSSLIHGGF